MLNPYTLRSYFMVMKPVYFWTPHWRTFISLSLCRMVSQQLENILSSFSKLTNSSKWILRDEFMRRKQVCTNWFAWLPNVFEETQTFLKFLWWTLVQVYSWKILEHTYGKWSCLSRQQHVSAWKLKNWAFQHFVQ